MNRILGLEKSVGAIDYTRIYLRATYMLREEVKSLAYRRRCEKMMALITLILEYSSVHGRILAVNMAHQREKRQLAENSSLGDNRNGSLGDNGNSSLGDSRNNSLGGNAFRGIQEANKGKEASAK